MIANLMQRYNPLFDSVRGLVQSQALGEVLRGSFENYASDENLPDRALVHWDRSKSGSIFREHGVHFFDLFEGWLGAGRVESAQIGVRPGTGIEEHVNCTVRYAGDALVNFYHGFHQTGRMDRQELRLVFERGDITLYDWVPTHARIRAILDERGTRGALRTISGFPPRCRLRVRRQVQRGSSLSGAGKEFDAFPGRGSRVWRRPVENPRLLLAPAGDDVGPGRLDSRPFPRAARHRDERPGLVGPRLRVGRARPTRGGGPMSVRRVATRYLLGPEDVPPSREDFEVVGAFNPGAVMTEDGVVLLVRVAERPRERREGYTRPASLGVGKAVR